MRTDLYLPAVAWKQDYLEDASGEDSEHTLKTMISQAVGAN